jgi:lipoate-protein ligase A
MRRPFLKKPASPQKSIKPAQKPVTARRKVATTANRPAAAPLAEAPSAKRGNVSNTKTLKPEKIKKEEFSFSVTETFRKKFKQAAKKAGVKKSDFLQILLAHWEDRQQKPPSGASL